MNIRRSHMSTKMCQQGRALRSLARSILGGIDGVEDVVQEAYCAALDRDRDGSVDYGWLATVVRNLARRRVRDDKRQRLHETSAAQRNTAPATDDVAADVQMHRDLADAVLALAEPYRTVLVMRFWHDQSPRVISKRLAVPIATVKTQLQRGLAMLRVRLDRRYGDRRAWVLPLVQIARPSSVATLSTGAVVKALTPTLTMNVKYMIVAAVGLLFVSLTIWDLVDSGESALSIEGPQVATGADGVERLESRVSPQRVELVRGDQRSESAAVKERGSLVVDVMYGDGRVAAGVGVTVGPRGKDVRYWGRRTHADQSGIALFDNLPVGEMSVRTSGFTAIECVQIESGRSVAVRITIPCAAFVKGVVVDSQNDPVAGADILLCPLATRQQYVSVVARSDAEGRFEFTAGLSGFVTGARAAGYSPSRMQCLAGKAGEHYDVTIRMPGLGGGIEGSVVSKGGKPIAGAIVKIGAGSMGYVLSTPEGVAALPLVYYSDRDGAFGAGGVPLGENIVTVRAAGYAPWSGVCPVKIGESATLKVVLGVGTTVRGVVRDESGNVVAGASVTSGVESGLTFVRDITNGTGAYELQGLSAGNHRLEASHAIAGKRTVHVICVEGEEVNVDLQLRNGIVLRGRVVDARRIPVEDASIAVQPWGAVLPGWYRQARSDQSGRFRVTNLPRGSVILSVRHPQFERLVKSGWDPKKGEVVMQLTRRPAKTSTVYGRLLDPTGQPVGFGRVTMFLVDAGVHPDSVLSDSETGEFKITVAPGEYRIRIEAAGYARFETVLKVEKNGRHGLGGLRLSTGGWIRVNVGASWPPVLSVPIYRADGRWVGSITSRMSNRRSAVLAPGRYRVGVNARGYSGKIQTVNVQEAVTSQVDLKIEPGIHQRFLFSLSPGSEGALEAKVRIRREGTVDDFVDRWVRCLASQRNRLDVWLVPGRYVLSWRVGDERGEQPLEVGQKPKAWIVKLR